MSPFADRERNREYQRAWKAAKRAKEKKNDEQADIPEAVGTQSARQSILAVLQVQLQTLDEERDIERTREELRKAERQADDIRRHIKALEGSVGDQRRAEAAELRARGQWHLDAADRIEAELDSMIENARAELLRLKGSTS